MSETDSFINEVTEEVRRDRLFRQMRRYGWIAVLAIVLLVGGAAWNEWRKASERAAAQDLGDAIIAALEHGDVGARVAALNAVDAPNDGAQAVLDLLGAAEMLDNRPQDAAKRLLDLAGRDGLDPIYRDLATLKAVTLPGAELDVRTRRTGLQPLAMGRGLTRLLAEEQLALIEVETGETEAAIIRLRAIAMDAEATAGLRRRATQVIVALGGEIPDMPQGA